MEDGTLKDISADITNSVTFAEADIINENGRCETSSRIIDGRFDVRAIDNMNLSHKKELKMLMHELVRKKDDEGKRVPDVDTTISMRDYQNMFNKKNFFHRKANIPPTYLIIVVGFFIQNCCILLVWLKFLA